MNYSWCRSHTVVSHPFASSSLKSEKLQYVWFGKTKKISEVSWLCHVDLLFSPKILGLISSTVWNMTQALVLWAVMGKLNESLRTQRIRFWCFWVTRSTWKPICAHKLWVAALFSSGSSSREQVNDSFIHTSASWQGGKKTEEIYWTN